MINLPLRCMDPLRRGKAASPLGNASLLAVDAMERRKSRTIFALALLSVLSFVRTSHADPEVDKILSRFASEPRIREVQIAAIEYYQVSPDRIRDLRSRTRMKGWVPGLAAGFTNSLTGNHRAVDDIIYRARGIAILEDQNSDYLSFNFGVNWGLDRLVFNAEELDVMSLIGIQDGVQREVTTLYYVRRRLQIEQLLHPATTIDARVSDQLRLEELTGLLDAYTGGYFSRTIKERQGHH